MTTTSCCQCWIPSNTHPFRSVVTQLWLTHISLSVPLPSIPPPCPSQLQRGHTSLPAAVVEPPVPCAHGVAGRMRAGGGSTRLYGVVAILTLLCPGISGSCALFIQLLWSNKSQKCVFVGFVVCLPLITFLCVLASLFYSSDWQQPPALQLRGLFCWCWAVFVDLWKWFSKNNI